MEILVSGRTPHLLGCRTTSVCTASL